MTLRENAYKQVIAVKEITAQKVELYINHLLNTQLQSKDVLWETYSKRNRNRLKGLFTVEELSFRVTAAIPYDTTDVMLQLVDACYCGHSVIYHHIRSLYDIGIYLVKKKSVRYCKNVSCQLGKDCVEGTCLG